MELEWLCLLKLKFELMSEMIRTPGTVLPVFDSSVTVLPGAAVGPVPAETVDPVPAEAVDPSVTVLADEPSVGTTVIEFSDNFQIKNIFFWNSSR